MGYSKQPSSRKSSRVVGGRRREVGGPDHPQGFLPLNWGGTEQKRTVTCMVLKAKANDRRKILALSRDEFRGPRPDFVRQVALVTTTTITEMPIPPL
ncbi:uncharacterized protein TNCV_4744941 [Trichonephila clavipes]|nr:uncharacterized protein TNCV_4744941 [Trichonephila clavipes]